MSIVSVVPFLGGKTQLSKSNFPTVIMMIMTSSQLPNKKPPDSQHPDLFSQSHLIPHFTSPSGIRFHSFSSPLLPGFHAQLTHFLIFLPSYHPHKSNSLFSSPEKLDLHFSSLSSYSRFPALPPTASSTPLFFF